MKVRKTTPEAELHQKEKYFLQLSGYERLALMEKLNALLRRHDVDYALRNKKVIIRRLK